jgi:hypothetical protein
MRSGAGKCVSRWDSGAMKRERHRRIITSAIAWPCPGKDGRRASAAFCLTYWRRENYKQRLLEMRISAMWQAVCSAQPMAGYPEDSKEHFPR